MKNRATDDLVDALHALTAETLLAEIQRYRAGVFAVTYGKEGVAIQGERLPIPPALLAQAAKFLKDNGIDSPARATALKDKLDGTLPSFDDVQDAAGLPN